MQRTQRTNRGHLLVLVAMSAVWSLGILTGTATVHAQTVLYVDDDAQPASDGQAWATAYDDLQLALDAAKAPGSTVTEILVAGGTYYPSAQAEPGTPRTETFQLINGVAIRGGYRGCPDGDCGSGDPDERNIALYETILSGDLNGDDGPDFANNDENSYHVFYHPEGLGLDETAVLDGCTITGGNADHPTSTIHDDGGGMYNHSSSPAITNCTIANNTAGESGNGVYCRDNSSPRITNCTITNNNAARDGGGIYCRDNSSPTITNCTITNNAANNDGGGIYCVAESNATITNCAIKDNTASGGSGIFCYTSSPTITNCSIANNAADEDGGGIYCYSSNPKITNCILWGDFPQEVYVRSGFPVITYSNIEGGWEGEGNIDLDPGFAFGSDYHLMADSPCIDAGTNDPPDGLPPNDPDGNLRPLDGNGDLLAVADMGVYEFNPNIPSIALSATTIEIFAPVDDPNPAEQVLQIRNCGGGMLNWEVVENCPWLVADPQSGSTAGQINVVSLSVDTTGLAHGVYEAEVTVTAPEAVNSPRTIHIVLYVHTTLHVPAEYATIQDAIDATVKNDLVLVADGIYTGLGNRNLDFSEKAITLRSQNGAETCIIDCENSGRGFYFHSGETSDSVVDGFTILNGKVTSSDPGGSDGGGIHCDRSSPTITNCSIKDNTAASGGGGICCKFSSPTITNCTIVNNTGRSGGGIYGWSSTATITNCAIANNNVTGSYGRGGAAYCGGSNSQTFTGCTITNNTADGDGGGIYCLARCSPTITNCTITNNTSQESGGGINCGSGNPTITDCTIANNNAVRDGGGIYGNFRTLTNCSIVDNTARDGGGIYCHSWNYPTVTGCTIANNNAARDGGGIYCFYESSPTITDCTITGNTAYADGGGIYSNHHSDPTITNCTISHNNAVLDGGGIFFDDSPNSTMTNCNVINNTSDRNGGGICCWGSNSTITNCTIANNTAHNQGGAVYSLGDDPTITHCTITGNTADEGGGGIYCNWGSPMVTNCSITGNTADENGGGIYCDSYSSPTITDCAIATNIAHNQGGGIYCERSYPQIANCVIAGNTADESGGGIYCITSRWATITNCVFWGDSPQEVYVSSGPPLITYSNIEGGWEGIGNIDADPLFVDPDNGDYHLLSGSPCINAGDPDYVTGPDDFDIDGEARVQQCRIDMGIDETPHFASDCNGNDIPDACDIADGMSNDCNANGTPDECEVCGNLDQEHPEDYTLEDVDADDYALFLAAFGSQAGDEEYLECADYDGDGLVSLRDYQTWLACYRAYVDNPLALPPVPDVLDVKDVSTTIPRSLRKQRPPAAEHAGGVSTTDAQPYRGGRVKTPSRTHSP